MNADNMEVDKEQLLAVAMENLEEAREHLRSTEEKQQNLDADRHRERDQEYVNLIARYGTLVQQYEAVVENLQKEMEEDIIDEDMEGEREVFQVLSDDLVSKFANYTN